MPAPSTGPTTTSSVNSDQSAMAAVKDVLGKVKEKFGKIDLNNDGTPDWESIQKHAAELHLSDKLNSGLDWVKEKGHNANTFFGPILKEVLEEGENFATKNKFGLAGGILALILGMALGNMDLLGGLLLGLAAFALIGSMDIGGVMSGFFNNILGRGKDDHTPDLSKGITIDPVPSGTNVNLVDAAGKPLANGQVVKIPETYGEEIKKVSIITGTVNTDTHTFEVREITPVDENAKPLPVITLNPPLKLDVKKNIVSLNSPQLDDARQDVHHLRYMAEISKDPKQLTDLQKNPEVVMWVAGDKATVTYMGIVNGKVASVRDELKIEGDHYVPISHKVFMDGGRTVGTNFSDEDKKFIASLPINDQAKTEDMFASAAKETLAAEFAKKAPEPTPGATVTPGATPTVIPPTGRTTTTTTTNTR